MTCACGSPITHVLRVPVRSERGMAERREYGCARCIDRLAWRLMAAGFPFLSAEVTT